ncbi:MAG TPA: toprim domain-containing protein [Bryobacteraceae bacterium]
MNPRAGNDVSLIDYLLSRGWRPSRDYGREEVAGLCPLHRETRPSFYVNRRKQVFYCHGCGRGGGIRQIRRWLEGGAWPTVQPEDTAGMFEQTYGFFERRLRGCPEARDYLRQRGIYDPDLIVRMRIGYAPGACLRAYLNRCGYRSAALRSAGLVDALGRDRLFRCVTFPLEEAASLYGRSIDGGYWRHRFLPHSKGGLYGWRRAQSYRSLIVVEGLFDLAALWQAGFPQAVALLGSHASPEQMAQLEQRRSARVHVCLDADANGAGQLAAQTLSERLRHAGVEALRVALPAGYDPASLFAAGASAQDFHRWLERARP